MSTAKMPLAGKRVLIAKPGLDGHDIGAKVVALALREAGADVIYTGLRKSPLEIAEAAVAAAVDLIGVSLLSGSHLELMKDISVELAKAGGADIPLVLGGTVPKEDHDVLMNVGVSAVYSSHMSLDDIVTSIAALLD